jgi:quercetin dioxygenase-like cupin family protein
MNQKEQPVEKRAQYVAVDSVETQLLDGCARTFRRDLLKNEYLGINQIVIKGSGDAEDYGTRTINRIQYVLDGKATLRQGGIQTDISQGQLIVVPGGMPWGPGFFVISEELTLLDIAPQPEHQGTVPSSDTDYADSIRIIRPEDVPSYSPAGHFNTTNRCLFLNEQVEIIEGVIESGGGAKRHFHQEHEQILYVLEGTGTSLLIYYPKGTPHGTEGGISTRLKLLVIYSPPLGESQNALG